MRPIRSLAPAIPLLLATVGTVAAAENPGALLLRLQCPGDTVAAGAPDADEIAPLVAAALTPLITGVVSQGLKAWGNKLKADSVEANVDVLHAGQHLYRWTDGGYQLAHRCWIAASKGKRETSRSLEELAAGYEKRELGTDGSGNPTYTWTNGETALTIALTEAGLSAHPLPATLIVLDVELSSAGTEARLVPRFVSLDHSLREWFRPSRPRTITLESSLTYPGSDKAFGAPVLKLDGLRVGEPKSLHPAYGDPPRVASNWFALPEVDAKSKSRASAIKAAKSDLKKETVAAISAHAAAKALDGTALPGITPVLPDDVQCLAPTPTLERMVAAHGALAGEQAKATPNKSRIALHTAARTYYDSCRRIHIAKDKLDDPPIGDARSFDVTTTIKEFRRRPFAAFFGDVLSDSDVQKGLTTAIVGAIDPATREAEDRKRQGARLKTLEAYEQAAVAAELAIIAHGAAAEADKAAKLVDMESKKRTANRAADGADLGRPYPGAGIWLD